MRSKMAFGLVVGLTVSWTAQAHASWAAVALEILIDESPLIVQGKVTKIVNGGFNVGQRRYDAALVDVSAVLKNNTGTKKIKQVRIAQPAAAGIAVSTDIRFRPGQTGIWLLTKDPQHNVYWAKHPSRYQPLKQAAKLKKLIAARKKLPAGKPVKGLVARSELVIPKVPSVNSKGGKAPKSYEIRFSLKNVSEKPIVVCNFLGYQPLVVEWTGPGDKRDPKKTRSVHYAWLARARLAAIQRQNFTTLPPGGVKFIGARGDHYGIGFSTAPVRETNLAEPGRHRVTVTFANRDDGEKFNLKNVWTGEVTAPPVVWKVE